MNIAEIKQYGSLNVLTATLMGEARGEPVEGIIAAGCVIRNRMLSNNRWFDTYEEVCLQRKQFSCWKENDNNYEVCIKSLFLSRNGNSQNPIYRQCRWVANGIISNWLIDNTAGANHYFNPKVVWPDWAATFHPVAKYGSHLFFRL